MKGGEESMLEEDSLLLECLEDIYLNFEQTIKKVQKVRSIHVQKLEYLLEELSHSSDLASWNR